MKPGVRDRYGLMPTGLKPLTPEQVLYNWYSQGIDDLGGKPHILVCWLATLAASDDLAPLAYTVPEIARKLDWSVQITREAAQVAAECGFVALSGDRMILTDPRTR